MTRIPALSPDEQTPGTDPRRTVIIDCDPGHDDALALLLAIGDPRVCVRAITTVHGNQTVDRVTDNAVRICDIAGASKIPVAAGATRPLVGDRLPDLGIHGSTGLDGPELAPPSRSAETTSAAMLIIEQLMAQAPGDITLIGLGPLTNFALACRLEPAIINRVAEVIVMAGGFTLGNRTPVAEFNVLSDPEAAHIVMSAGWPVSLVGLDVTNRVLATPGALDPIAQLDSPVSRFVLELIDFYTTTYRSYDGVTGFAHPPVHDVCAVALAIAPELFELRDAPVSVELDGKLTRGMTVADLRSSADDQCRTRIARDVDAAALWQLITSALARLSAAT